MKTFGFDQEEKILIINYLLSHRMKRKDSYSDTQWETVKKQRMRARKAIKPFLDPSYRDGIKTLKTLNFDSLTHGRRLGIDDDNKVFHIPVDDAHLNEEITNLLRKIINRKSKYVW